MPTSTDVTKLNINELTETQYDAAVLAGTIGANDLSFLTDVNVETQVSIMPVASADELGKVYQFIGTTDANYTHGYFYECVSDGLQPATYSWSNVQVQANSGGLPSQTGNAGKFLTTDGTDASWGDTVSHINVNKSADGSVLDILGNTLISPTIFQLYCWDVSNTKPRIQFYWKNTTLSSSIAFKEKSILPSSGIMLGDSSNFFANVYTNKINNGNDIIVPTVSGSMAVQVSTVPTADSILEGKIYQYVGATDSTYTNGRFYKCVSDGQATPTYSWEEVSMGGGGSSYTAGTGIDITGGVISVTSPTVQNYATANDALQISRTTPSVISTGVYSTAIGNGSYVKSANGVAIGRSSTIGQNATGSIAIGSGANAYSDCGAIIIGGGSAATQGNGTFSVSLSTNGNLGTWHTYKVVDSDGTIPAARHASLPASDGTYVLKLVISGGVPTLSWVAE